MYSTKELNPKIAKSYLSLGDPYRDPHSNTGKNSRIKGKQFQTIPAKNTCNGGGYFQKKTYASDPLQDNTMYLKTQPVDKRKSGFGTHDASRRGEFMSHIRTEQYRETLRKEIKIVEEQQQKLEPVEDVFKSEDKKFPEGLKETKFLFDIGRAQVTEFNQKSHRDTFYTMRTGNSDLRRNNGHFVLSSESIGAGANSVDYKPANARSATTKQFYDHSHLHIY